MNKKHIKFLFVLLTVFIMFLVNKNVVKADALDYICSVEPTSMGTGNGSTVLHGCGDTNSGAMDDRSEPCLSDDGTYYYYYYNLSGEIGGRNSNYINAGDIAFNMSYYGTEYSGKPVRYILAFEMGHKDDVFVNDLSCYSKIKNYIDTHKYTDEELQSAKDDNNVSQEQKDRIKKSNDELHESYTIKRVNPENPNANLEADTKIKCEDVKVFHTIYVVMIILAPMLVIVLGSVDFAQAVIASDEKKMQEFKGKFPKRLTALIILILVPIIIKLILAFVNLKSGLMDCIINGFINF